MKTKQEKNHPFIYETMSKVIVVSVFVAALVAMSASAVPTTQDQLTSLSLEVKALQKDNDLLTGSLKENWVEFSSQCGNVLAADECLDLSKSAEKEVEEIDAKKKEWMNKPHHEGRKLQGGKHHGGKKHHGGNKHHKGGKGGKPEMPSFAKATYCVLKQAYMTDAKVTVSAHCKRAAQRFELYQSVHRKPSPHHGKHHGPPPHHTILHILAFAFVFIAACGIGRCVRRKCKKKTEARHVQAQGVVYLGQPVVVTGTEPDVQKV